MTRHRPKYGTSEISIVRKHCVTDEIQKKYFGIFIFLRSDELFTILLIEAFEPSNIKEKMRFPQNQYAG